MAARGLCLVGATFALFSVLPLEAKAGSFAELAKECMVAAQSGETATFNSIATEIRGRKDVFDDDARSMAEECLSLGYGERWEYYYPARQFMAVSEVEARLKAAADSRADKKAEAAALEAEARRMEREKSENAQAVALRVYLACKTLLDRDEIAAMTNELCVDTFMANGLP